MHLYALSDISALPFPAKRTSNKENAPKAPTTGAKRGPMPLPRDSVEEGNLIVKMRKPRNNKENGK